RRCDPRRIRDRGLRCARRLDAALEHRRPQPRSVQPAPRPRRLERRLPRHGVRDPRLHRLRGCGATRGGGAQPAADRPVRRRRLGRTHPRFKTPHVAIIWMSVIALVLSLALGWKWGPLVGFAFIATLAVIVVVVVYILICLGCIWHYWTKRRAEFNPLLHLVLPAAGAVLFFFPLYYEYVKFPPTYPIKYANWIAIGWVAVGVVLAVFLWLQEP